MVRNYTRKSTRQTWDEIVMATAIGAGLKNEMRLLTAATNHNVSKTTLQNRVQLYKTIRDMELGTVKDFGIFEIEIHEVTVHNSGISFIVVQQVWGPSDCLQSCSGGRIGCIFERARRSPLRTNY